MNSVHEWFVAGVVALVGGAVVVAIAIFMAGSFGSPDAPTGPCNRFGIGTDCMD